MPRACHYADPMQLRSLAYRTDLALLTASGSTVQDLGTHLLVTTEDNPTFHWGNFLLLKHLPLPGGAKEVVGAFDAWFPTSQHRAVGVDTIAEVDLSEFVAAGLSESTEEVLVADRLQAPERPNTDGGVRPITSDEWEKWIDFEMSLRDPHVTATYLRARAAAEQRLVEAGLGHRWAVFVDGKVAASAAVYAVGDGLARFQQVATHPRRRRRGMASTLIHRMGEAALARPDVHRLVMVAEPEGPAIALYKKLGFSTYERQVALYQSL